MSDLEMQINRHDIWCDSIFNAYIPEVDNRGILNFYEEMRSKEEGITRSNIGGWQFDVGFNMCEALDDMFHKVEHAVNHIFKEVLRIDQNVVLANAWLNSNQYGHGNCLHTHPGSVFSGVYYINGDGKIDNGTINFVRDNGHSIESALVMSDRLRDYSQEKRDYSWKVACAMPARESHALLFGPWVLHEVVRNLTQEDRVVVGLNFCPGPDS